MWLRAVVSADWTHDIIWKLRWLYVKLNNTRIKLLLKDKIYSKYNQRIKLQKKRKKENHISNPKPYAVGVIMVGRLDQQCQGQFFVLVQP